MHLIDVFIGFVAYVAASPRGAPAHAARPGSPEAKLFGLYPTGFT